MGPVHPHFPGGLVERPDQISSATRQRKRVAFFFSLWVLRRHAGGRGTGHFRSRRVYSHESPAASEGFSSALPHPYTSSRYFLRNSSADTRSPSGSSRFGAKSTSARSAMP